MNKSNLGTILGVLAAVVIAWLLVDVVLHLTYLLVKVVLVAIVAVVVYAVIRRVLSRRS